MPIQRAKIALNQITGGTPLTSVASSDLPAGLAKIFVEKNIKKIKVKKLENLKSIFAKISSY